MSFHDHAERELRILGTPEEDIQYLLKVVDAFSEYGHSGGSASWFIPVLNDILQFRALSPLTDDPEEWMEISDDVSGKPDLYQSRRQAEAFSSDGGKTYYLLSEAEKHGYPPPIHETTKKETANG